VRLALLQIDSTVGAVRSNRLLVADAWGRARAGGAELAITPELVIPGYPPRDLVERADFVRACREELEGLAAVTAHGGALLCGTVERAPGAVGKPVHNSAALLRGGRVERIFHKSLLPTYDVFDEARYFRPARPEDVSPVEIGGWRVGVTICEDVWNDADFWSHRLYEFDPAERLVRAGAEVLLNLSASPFHLGKQGLRRRMLGRLARDARLPVVHCNLVGGNDDLVFDGASFVAWPDGRFGPEGLGFAEDLVFVDLPAGPPGGAVASGAARMAARAQAESPAFPDPDAAAAVDALCLGLRDYFRKCGFRDAVVGLSGGIDSALTAALAARALGPERVTGITMPSRFSSAGSVGDSRILSENLGISFQFVPIDPLHGAWRTVLSELFAAAGLSDGAAGAGAASGITDQNIQARIRGNVLMAFSNRTGALLLSTGNKSELACGYCTLYGDMAGGLALISDLPKTLVYRCARELNRQAGRELIPRSSIEKPPSAELAPDQLDTDSLPPYDVLDPILQGYLEEAWDAARIARETGAPAATVERVIRMVDRNEFKRRQAAPGLRITSKAFGSGRRFPVAARFEHHGFAR
jgi:NAD+ synthetase